MKGIIELQRETPVGYETDVLVVGGGSAGFSAALASARTGAKTILVERYGFLGGMMTGGLVLGFPRVLGGINEELVAKLESIGASFFKNERITIDPEITKWALDEMLIGERVKILFHAHAVDVALREKMIDAVIIESKSGRQAIKARAVVDATGDGDIAYFSGCSFEMGDENGITLPVTTALLLQNTMVNDGLHVGEKWHVMGGQDAQEMRINGLNIEELSQAEILLRKEAFLWLRRERGSSEHKRFVFISKIASQIGVRETRRIIGAYTLKLSDWKEKRKFWDNIGLTYQGNQIPCRSLFPREIDNLLIAGRCVSYARDIINPMRIISTCISTGQGSGITAALASKKEVSTGKLNITPLQRELKKQKVRLKV